jgi:endonuclease YncB( thermonuclease family)
VYLSQVIDGDTIIAKDAEGNSVTVRLLGIKALPDKPDKDPASAFGKGARLELERQLRGRPVRVMLHSPPKDRHGRYLAELFVDDREISLTLLREGLALVYTAFPFPSMSLFLHEQEVAKSERKGLWADPEIARRAQLLLQQWSREAQ